MPHGSTLIVLFWQLAHAWNSSICMHAAEIEIRNAPEKSQMFVTTSHLYKRHLAEYFCGMGGNMTALELGVYHGHTTAVLAAIFRRVISVDIEKEYLEVASKNAAAHANVIFLSMDLMADDWTIFSTNQVSVGIIDANHHYEYVMADAQNALRHLPHLQYLVFDDYHEEEVERAVTELEEAGVLVECQGIGNGWNGSPWEFQDWDPGSGQQFKRWTTQSEGRICKRSPARAGWKTLPGFVNKRFFVYRQPLTHLCQAGVFRFLANGTLLTSWESGGGSWQAAASTTREDLLILKLPGLLSSELELIFNSGRTAFMLSEVGSSRADWFGIYDQLVNRPFQIASSLFWLNSCENLRARCKPVDFSKTCNVSWCASPSDSLFVCLHPSMQEVISKLDTFKNAQLQERDVLKFELSWCPGPSIEFAVFWLIRGGAGSGCLANCARASCSRGAALAHVFSYGHAGDAFCSRAVLNAR